MAAAAVTTKAHIWTVNRLPRYIRKAFLECEFQAAYKCHSMTVKASRATTTMRAHMPPSQRLTSARLCCRAGILLIAEYTGGVPMKIKIQ